MFSGFRQSQLGQSVNAFAQRDQMQAVMGFKGVHNNAQSTDTQPREIFDMKTIKMPKMVIKDAPKYCPWGHNACGGHGNTTVVNADKALKHHHNTV